VKKGSSLLLMAGTAVLFFGLGYSFRGTRLTSDSGSPTAAANNPTKPGAPAPGAVPPADKTVYKVPVGNSPQKGPDDALVTIVEFSDFQCPFCSRVLGTQKQITEEYGNKVRFVFKHNPLPFHKDAPAAAEASMAAHDQGKFWEMHDKLFGNQQQLDQATFEKHAQELGLNMDKFKAAMSSNAHKAQIEADQKLSQTLGANGTPSFFVNGRSLRGAQPFPNFKALIDEELAKAEALIKSGTSKSAVYAELTKGGLEKAAEQKPAAPAAPQGRRKVEFSKDDPAKGGKNPKVTIVEFSDFECPFCSRVNPTMKQIMDTYKDDVKVVFKHNPLPFHKNAPGAAAASLAAHEQGKFWEMHDKLFANQQALNNEAFEKYAKEIGLNVDKFKASLAANKFNQRIEDDKKLAASTGAGGTPAFFVNGKLVSGAQPFENFKTVIDAEIAKADELLKKGVKREALYAEVMKESSNTPPPPAEDEEDNRPANVPVGTSALRGDAKAPVTIIAFSDFQCPFCSRVVPTLTRIEQEYKGKVKIAFKHQPLPFHPNAVIAAQAAEAAKDQGKFWEMHDKLFANQQALGRDNLVQYAKDLGLDAGKFEKSLDSDKAKQQIESDKAEATKAGANGTPTFFVNGRRVVGAVPFENFKSIIDEELKKAGKGT
jgi:protein-disulfide isomerase